MTSQYNDVVPRTLQVRLARMASLEYQQKYCISGTASEYVLLDELLDTTLYAVRHYLAEANEISHSNKRAFELFLAKSESQLDQIPWQDKSISISQIVVCDRMKEIRDAAANCLHGISASLSIEDL
jgi:hypothetical protein